MYLLASNRMRRMSTSGSVFPDGPSPVLNMAVVSAWSSSAFSSRSRAALSVLTAWCRSLALRVSACAFARTYVSVGETCVRGAFSRSTVSRQSEHLVVLSKPHDFFPTPTYRLCAAVYLLLQPLYNRLRHERRAWDGQKHGHDPR